MRLVAGAAYYYCSQPPSPTKQLAWLWAAVRGRPLLQSIRGPWCCSSMGSNQAEEPRTLPRRHLLSPSAHRRHFHPSLISPSCFRCLSCTPGLSAPSSPANVPAFDRPAADSLDQVSLQARSFEQDPRSPLATANPLSLSPRHCREREKAWTPVVLLPPSELSPHKRLV